MSESAKWYVVHTYSGYENKVKITIEKTVENRGLQDMIQEVLVPMEIVTEIKEEAKEEKERKLFPGYVFVKMIVTDETWYIVRNVRGVTGFVGESTDPIPLSDDEVKKLGIRSTKTEVSYSVGDNVNVVDGPLKDLVGIVSELDVDQDRVVVVVSMFGRETPVELSLAQVTALK